MAIGTHVFQPVKTPTLTAEEVIAFQKWTNNWGLQGDARRFYKLRTTETLFFSPPYFPGYLTQCFTYTRSSIKPYLTGLRSGDSLSPPKNAFIVKSKFAQSFLMESVSSVKDSLYFARNADPGS